MFTQTITLNAAFVAGLLSFLSPCVLPLIPAYFTFITGMSLDELTRDVPGIRRKVIAATLAYVSGFSAVFILLGASASFLGSMIAGYADIIRYAGGGIILIFGLHLLGVFRIRQLEFEKRLHLKQKPLHLLGTFVIGMAFGAGWSPCIGPLLGTILIVAGNQDTVGQGILLLTLYSVGLALPFVLISVFITSLLPFIKKATRFIPIINRIAGILLILMGLLLIFDRLHLLMIA